MAVVAKATSKPFYVVAECFKFVREYPLTQWDVRNPDKVRWMCVSLDVCVCVCACMYLDLPRCIPVYLSCYSQLNFKLFGTH